jgi:hypothetical protein
VSAAIAFPSVGPATAPRTRAPTGDGDVVAAPDPSSVLVLCQALEYVPKTGWGMLAVTDEAGHDLGGVFVHDGRVCGAIAADVGFAAPGSPPTADALLRRTADAVAVLATGHTRRWSHGIGKGFEPRTTFSIAEVLATTLAGNHLTLAASAARAISMAPWLGDDAVLLAYSADSELPLPIAIGGVAAVSVRDVLELGRIGFDALVAAGCLAGRPSLVVAAPGDNGAAVATWRDGRVLYVARLAGPLARDRLLHGWTVMQ